MIYRLSLFISLLLLISTECFAIVPIPARIGGTVTIDGKQLTQQESSTYSFHVKKVDGSSLNPQAQSTALNNHNWYVIDIPIFNANDQAGGAHSGDQLAIHVYNNGHEMKVVTPSNGMIKCLESGSTSQINLIIQNSPKQ